MGDGRRGWIRKEKGKSVCVGVCVSVGVAGGGEWEGVGGRRTGKDRPGGIPVTV